MQCLHALVGAAAVMASAAAAPALVLVDDFASPGLSATRWTLQQANGGSVLFTGGQAYLDVPFATVAGNRAQMFAKGTVVRFNATGQAFRVTWDQQITQDRPNAFYNGVGIGEPAGVHVGAGQGGRKNDDSAFAPFHDFMLSGAPVDTLDHGTAKYHYDLATRVLDAATGDVDLLLSVYQYDPALDALPEQYPAAGTLVETFHSTRVLPAQYDNPLYFWVERDDAFGDLYANMARAQISVDNVYAEFTPAPEPATGLLLLVGAGSLLLRRRSPRGGACV